MGAGGSYFPPPRDFQPPHAMSKHNSLKSSATVGGKRSVLKRFERVKLLRERGEWQAGRSPVGLPKTKHEG
jgi:small basic protein (TIGR04137 family)